MLTIYVYLLDTLADWELGYVTAELHSGRFFKEGAPQISLKTVSTSKEPIKTMGGLMVTPDCLISDMVVSKESVLLLPGATTWNAPRHGAILETAGEFLSIGATVCAICGATAALAGVGLLDHRPQIQRRYKQRKRPTEIVDFSGPLGEAGGDVCPPSYSQTAQSPYSKVPLP